MYNIAVYSLWCGSDNPLLPAPGRGLRETHRLVALDLEEDEEEADEAAEEGGGGDQCSSVLKPPHP